QIKQTLGKRNTQTKHEDTRSESHRSHSSYKLSRSSSASGSYVPMQEFMERKAKAEAARVQMEYEKKQLELKKIKAELVENEVKVKAEIQRRQSEIQANMDVLDAEMNLSVAEAELKVFEDELENSRNTTKLQLPTLIECNQIPDNKNEVPTPEVARCYSHLQDIAELIPPVNDSAKTLLLLGRDIISVHHVEDQRIGSAISPYGQKLSLGWVIIGETCIGKAHKSDQVNVNKTFILHDGQPSLHPPCVNNFHIRESNLDSLFCEPDSRLFIKTKDDNKSGKSTEDREFETIMAAGMMKNEQGNWEAPLPFKPDRPPLPNNKELAMKRAKSLEISLIKDEAKREHFLTFMSNILDKGFAEEVHKLPDSEECWYLPIFGVYHPKKPAQIRVVFDSSAQCQGLSLNQVLLTGPNLTNDLLGILLRFRQGPVAVTVDIQQMFYGFYVQPDQRKYLRFFWYKENDMNKGLVEYQMKVHVFGNTTSPAIATYALRKTVEESDSDVKNFVVKNFYVDDGLLSTQTVQEAADLIKRTQKDLAENGNLKLHKITSNSLELMNHFPNQDLSKEIQDLNFTEEYLPFHQSLGLKWNLQTDSFMFNIPLETKPFTKRGILSVINSIFDPIGFIAPVKIKGKMLVREISQGTTGWDEELPQEYMNQWSEWTSSLDSLKDVKIQRSYTSKLPEATKTEVHIFSDASEKAIGAVAYLKTYFSDNRVNIGFLLGKAKLAPLKEHSLPRLELCAAVMAVEIHETVQESLDIRPGSVKYYTDSQVVLGYINNTTRRFYTYVSNRVDQIRSLSTPSDWSYVNTKHNPADLATRSVPSSKLQDSMWLNGPKFLQNSEDHIQYTTVFRLLDPEPDKEIRPEVVVQKTQLNESTPLINRFTKFGSWISLVRAIARLKQFVKSFKARKEKTHSSELKTLNPQIMKEAETFIVKETQRNFYPEDLDALRRKCQMNKNSNIIPLNPFLDCDGTIRVGGRLKNAYLSQNELHPIILPGRSYVAKLIVLSCHEKVFHQGRHITEGAVRSSGYWNTGCKRLVSSLIYRCVTCRKLRWKEQHQLMADLPKDRLMVGAPFLNIGVDVFGPWQVVTRKTRGGTVNNKRWAALFTCLCTRAVHIEVLEEMSTSSFINALKRFITIRGNVKIIRSDRGTNFIGTVNTLHLNCVNVEDTTAKSYLEEKGITWIFNSPHSSHMGGVWERMIKTARRILDALLLDSSTKNLTHEVLVTFLAEVSAIINSRPITVISTDPENPIILSPALLLTHKDDSQTATQFESDSKLDMKDIYRAQWKRVQCLSELFWQKWKKDYLHTLQTRRKWKSVVPDLTEGSIVLLKDNDVPRQSWPLARIVKVLPSDDGRIRKVIIRVHRDGKNIEYTRPISELVLLVKN
ncbi:uncharacterized protein LOC134272834, partial [Saccostrea cucullata]|uniref:uncharacterized protein LOC134272834 n=1 Tax=Saccostrea cuccullata TaxID=36930 RepID=UPI002ED138B4